MKKKISIVLIMILLISFIFILEVHADDIIVNEWKPSDTASNTKLSEIGGKILGVIQVAGTIISIIVLIILGIKYMCGSIEERVQYRKTMVPYIIGAILVFATSNVLAFAYNIITDLEHVYEDDYVVAYATCAKEGVMRRKCKDCGKTIEVPIPRNDSHSLPSNWTTDSEATCTRTGLKVKKCQRTGCNYKITELIAVDKNKHNYYSEVTLEATCLKEGVMTYKCKDCSNSYPDRINKENHDYTVKTGNTQVANCIKPKQAEYKCRYSGCEKTSWKNVGITKNEDNHVNKASESYVYFR